MELTKSSSNFEIVLILYIYMQNDYLSLELFGLRLKLSDSIYARISQLRMQCERLCSTHQIFVLQLLCEDINSVLLQLLPSATPLLHAPMFVYSLVTAPPGIPHVAMTTMISSSSLLPFKCPQCGKCFAQAQYLKQHRYLHAEPSFQCHLCLRKFRWASSLKAHSCQRLQNEPAANMDKPASAGDQ